MLNPSYGNHGQHIEAILVTYDEKAVSYAQVHISIYPYAHTSTRTDRDGALVSPASTNPGTVHESPRLAAYRHVYEHVPSIKAIVVPYDKRGSHHKPRCV